MLSEVDFFWVQLTDGRRQIAQYVAGLPECPVADVSMAGHCGRQHRIF
jgi:hypothetical protein